MRKGIKVAIYSINNYGKLKDFYLHDSELQNIMVNYNKKEIEINLITATNLDTNTREIKLFFNGVRNLHVPMLEPWGSGFYINSIDLEVEEDYIKTIITLNSGDEIKCDSETIETDYSY